MADFEELKNELIKSYQDLLELQYHEKPKAREHIKTICESLIADMVLWKIQEQCMDVDVSVGVQLDIIGKWVDIDRYFKGNKYKNNKWYAYYDWDEKDQPNSLQGGMWDWDTSEKPNNAPFLNYDWILVIKNKLNDDDFRTLIKLKIIKNNTNATCKNIDDEIYKLFKGVIYTIWGEKLFDKSKFTVVGNPTITDDGIASGFSNSNYIDTGFKLADLYNKKWTIKTKTVYKYLNNKGAFGATLMSDYNGLHWLTQGNISIDNSNKNIVFYGKTIGGAEGANILITNTETNIKDGDIIDLYLSFDLEKYTLKAVINNSTTITKSWTPTTDDKNLVGTQTSGTIYINSRRGSGLLTDSNCQIDLKKFSITVDGKEVFSGTKDKVMELTYKYPENQTSIMNLAKIKNCLPCPSGVHLKMEGIPDNE